ncbi:hypothetical protein FSP39_008288 [Pinctada imbricata]|uniref:CCHC-type domain-containing protein n=1 Tax=Pinctada imbricata TaxID=66713 RepID=A0AA88YNA0_PINIB|nr:hypothetical protein FSP39_008288 [Pinctada imbricata]
MSTDPEIPEDELRTMAKLFKELKVKPKMDSPDDFKHWMADYVKQADIKPTVKVNTDSTTDTTVKLSSHYRPKLSNFYGDGSKSDIPYDQWRYEVDCLVREKYDDSIIAQSIRNSLKGNAAQVAMRLGPEAKVPALLEEMESIFGSIEKGESIMQEFYSASQRQSEDSMTWSCRVEEIYRKAIKRDVATKEDQNSKVRARYWNGLHQWLRDITAYKFDSIMDFDELRREVRMIEKDHDVTKVQSKMAMAPSDPVQPEKPDELKEIKGMIQQLTTKMNDMEKQQTYRREYPRGSGYGQGKGQQRQQYNRGYRHTTSNRPPYQQEPWYIQQNEPSHTEDGEPICYRCRQPGHLAVGCRVLLDHSRRGLNYNRPSSRGRR